MKKVKVSKRVQEAKDQRETVRNGYVALIHLALAKLHDEQIKCVHAVVVAFRDCQSVQSQRLMETIFGKPRPAKRRRKS